MRNITSLTQLQDQKSSHFAFKSFSLVLYNNTLNQQNKLQNLQQQSSQEDYISIYKLYDLFMK